jgi:adenylate cyclase
VTAVAMPSTAFLTVGIGAVVAALGYAFWRVRAEAEHLRRRLENATTSLEQLQLSFARFAPQEVVERIIASGVSTSAEKKTVTVLFADIVGFTALSESMEPALLVQIVNGYLARMSRAIAEHRGHVSKFIGDGILALFGAVEPNPWQADDAARAALAMREALKEYNKELALAGQPALRVGIGLHRGVAVAGVIGCEELVEFTVIGSTVNLASRVDHLTRRHAADILITAAVREALDARFALQELPAAAVAGISEPVVTYASRAFCPADGRALDPPPRAGPERAPFNEIVAPYLKAVGDPRKVVRDPEARYWGGRVKERSLVPLGEARLGRISLDDWLRRSKAKA